MLEIKPRPGICRKVLLLFRIPLTINGRTLRVLTKGELAPKARNPQS